MTGALIVYAIAAVSTTLIVARWARWDGAGFLTSMICASIIGAAWPFAVVLYLRHEAPYPER